MCDAMWYFWYFASYLTRVNCSRGFFFFNRVLIFNQRIVALHMLIVFLHQLLCWLYFHWEEEGGGRSLLLNLNLLIQGMGLCKLLHSHYIHCIVNQSISGKVGKCNVNIFSI